MSIYCNKYDYIEEMLSGDKPENCGVLAHHSNNKMKKALRETQTLCARCSKAKPKFFAPPQTPSRRRRTAKI